ncbi:hypothetical protein L204_101146 [Cryptococcus depauperatus]|nr:signal recognition particle subunit SRP68 [Cryptococcus depauperatus CBS 7855]
MVAQEMDISFDVLNLLSKERAVYGLRNSDYERYRRHCSNKIHRLRQATSATCGKGKKYQSPPKLVAEAVKDVRQIHLILFSVERALAHSHEFKHLKTKNPSLRKDQLSWLRQAFKLSNTLYNLASALSSPYEGHQAKIDLKTLGQITIYHLTIKSELAFEKANWIGALADLAARRKLLSTFAEGAKDSFDQALAAEFIDSHDPFIRYCAYKLGRAESHDIDGVISEIEPEVLEEAITGFNGLIEKLRVELSVKEIEADRKGLADLEFFGEKVELRNAEIVNVMIKVQNVFAKLSNGNTKGGREIKQWDRVLGVLGEAEAVARKLLEDHDATGAKSSLKSAKTAQSLSFTHQYIVYLFLSHRIRRDLSLLSSLSTSSLPSDPAHFKVQGGRSKLEEAIKTLGAMVKIYDTIIQSLRQAAELSIVQEREGVQNGVEGLECYFNAIKCYNLARLHCIHPSPSFASAIELLVTATLSLGRSRDLLTSSLDEPIVSIPMLSLDELEENIKTAEKAAKKGLFALTVEKPVFFDMAFNYIEVPIDELQRLAGNKKVKVAEQRANEGLHAQVKTVEQSNKDRERENREATPAAEETDRTKSEEGKKGWLGGWFGRK